MSNPINQQFKKLHKFAFSVLENALAFLAVFITWAFIKLCTDQLILSKLLRIMKALFFVYLHFTTDTILGACEFQNLSNFKIIAFVGSSIKFLAAAALLQMQSHRSTLLFDKIIFFVAGCLCLSIFSLEEFAQLPVSGILDSLVRLTVSISLSFFGKHPLLAFTGGVCCSIIDFRRMQKKQHQREEGQGMQSSGSTSSAGEIQLSIAVDEQAGAADFIVQELPQNSLPESHGSQSTLETDEKQSSVTNGVQKYDVEPDAPEILENSLLVRVDAKQTHRKMARNVGGLGE